MTRFKNALAVAATAALLGLHPVAQAQEENSREGMVGLGAGAVVGAVAGGPLGLAVGAIIGNVIGEGYGERADISLEKDAQARRVAELELALGKLREENIALQLERQQLTHSLAQHADLRASRELEASLAMDVLFRTNSGVLEPAAQEQIAELGETLRRFPNLKVRLEGHADRRGPEDANLQLATSRAETVRQVLIQAGVAAERIEMVALGESRARAERTDTDGLALDRRVSIQIQSGQQEALQASRIKL